MVTREQEFVCVCFHVSISFLLINLPEFNYGDPTVITLFNSNHFLVAPSLNPIARLSFTLIVPSQPNFTTSILGGHIEASADINRKYMLEFKGLEYNLLILLY